MRASLAIRPQPTFRSAHTLPAEVQVGIGRLADHLGIGLGWQHLIELLPRVQMVKDDIDRVRLQRAQRQVQPRVNDLEWKEGGRCIGTELKPLWATALRRAARPRPAYPQEDFFVGQLVRRTVLQALQAILGAAQPRHTWRVRSWRAKHK